MAWYKDPSGNLHNLDKYIYISKSRDISGDFTITFHHESDMVAEERLFFEEEEIRDAEFYNIWRKLQVVDQ